MTKFLFVASTATWCFPVRLIVRYGGVRDTCTSFPFGVYHELIAHSVLVQKLWSSVLALVMLQSFARYVNKSMEGGLQDASSMTNNI
jgi:hypothetical protein